MYDKEHSKDKNLLKKRANYIMISVMIFTFLRHITNVFKSGGICCVAQNDFMGRRYVLKKK
jgi:hypothetical protein